MTESPDIGLAIGEVVGERYRVLSTLGAGGMGTVYRVEHTLMAKEMAMKLLRPELSSIPQIVERFEREARSASKLDNQHIVRITDFGRAPTGALYLVMELLEGDSLTQRIQAKGALSVAEALDYVDQILIALEHAHSQGIVHRDLKPDNMMLVTRDGRTLIKILDFGLAKVMSRDDEKGATLTQAGMVFGTPRYMAPEQAAAEPVDERTDLYAVGVLLYEMLAGRAPFTGTNAVDLLTAHLTQAPPPLELNIANRALSERLEAIVRRALEKHKKDRYENAAQFRAALSELVSLFEGSEAELFAKKTGSTPTAFADTMIRRSNSATHAPPEQPIEKKRIVAGAIAAALGIIGLVFFMSGSGEGLQTRAERALEKGDLSAARAILGQLVAKNAREPKTQVLIGHVAMAEGDIDGAIDAYKTALELDGSVDRDPVFVANVKRIVEKNPKQLGTLITALALHADSGAAELLASLAQEAPTQRMRNHAFQALERLGETSRLDLVKYLGTELERTSDESCKLRKWYVDRLAALDDARVLPILKREKGRRGGLFKIAQVNGCMNDELNAYIAKLEGKK